MRLVYISLAALFVSYAVASAAEPFRFEDVTEQTGLAKFLESIRSIGRGAMLMARAGAM
jgi:hypothetical protein